ncbi:MAG: phage tail sheath family protein [Cyanothece sp. SIO1E1]|nr:phage tail sheath family protein [Cyanothece sp. SIO1E1]
MPSTYKTPGVYIEEISKFPPSVAEVETAIPAFIGYTQQATVRGTDYTGMPVRIMSLLEYEQFFGTAENETGITVTATETEVNAAIANPSPHIMYYALQAYFANGGGPCYIVSVGKAAGSITQSDLDKGLKAIEKEDEVTLIVFPESLELIKVDQLAANDAAAYSDYKALYDAALAQCAKLQDRFVVMDAKLDIPDVSVFDASGSFRSNGIGTGDLKYGAAYGPRLETIFDYAYKEDQVNITLPDGTTATMDTINPTTTPDTANGQYYPLAKSAIGSIPVVLPAAPLVVGVYAAVDSSRGVWKAPANVSLSSVIKPTIKISSEEQENLNLDTTGKAVNAIRSFTGKGTLIWGARTLAGNDNEWRYVPVRRFFNMAEESIKKATEQFVFEPNDANTWTKVQAMIENFLILQWRAGALAGAKPDQAFYVKVGLNQTMTALDILEGRMIVEIGMAVVRPAEFIILKFSHKMQES